MVLNKMKNFLISLFRKSGKAEKKGCYFGLVLKEAEGQALLLEVNQEEKKARIIAERKFVYSNSWEQLVDDIDDVLFELEKENNTQVEKTIFIFYSHLVNQKTKEIKEPYLQKIKQLVRELELKPLGYIEYHEAVSLYLKEKEEIPLTSLIIELDKSSISLLLYKGGELIFSQSTAKTEDLISDLETMFNQIKREIILPSRLIIYDSEGLEEQVEKIVTHRWSKDLFFQLPRAEILNKERLKEALIFSFSQQIFGERQVELREEKKQEEILGFVIGKDIQETVRHPQEKVVIQKPEKLIPIKWKFLPHSSLLVLIGFFLIILAIFTELFYFHQASLVIYFPGKKIEKELKINGSFQSPPKNNEILIEKINQEVAEEDSLTTSGKKIVGEKAKGEVTIYNSSFSEKEFKKGTSLTSSSGIEFILDTDVKVASASQSLTAEGNLLTVTGKAKATITASQIGPAGNIDKNDKLKIDNFALNLFFALPNSPFSGGSKREIQTVSRDDLEKLKTLVNDKIKRKGISLVKNKLTNNQILEKLIKLQTIEEKYSKELGEEAKNLSLAVKDRLTFYTLNKDSLKQLLLKSLAKSTEPPYELSPESINYSLKEEEEKEEKVILTVAVSAKTIAKVDKKQLFTELVGKNSPQVEKIIKEKFKALGYEMKIKTNLPFLKSRLPFFGKNIELTIKSL